MSGFFDTNILVYAQQAGAKADRARTVMAGGGRISVQVLNEFTAVARRKLGHDWCEIEAAIDDALVLAGPPLALTLDLHIAARRLGEQHRLAFYDGLIVAAAIEAGCDTLYSEDMQHGQVIGSLRIQNPFIESSL